MRGTVSPLLTEFLTQVNAAIAEAKTQNIQFTPDMVRANLDKLAAFNTQVPDLDISYDTQIQQQQQQVAVRVYSPNRQQALPVIIYYHGGGHMCGSVELYDPMCRKLAIAANAVVISVEYRLAPEFPYPAGIKDCTLALRHYQQALTDVAFQPKVIIAGDSAGGAICTTLSRQSLTDDSLVISQQVLIYPSVDYTMSMPSFEENGQGFLLESSKVAWYFDHYFQRNDDRHAASALFGPFTSQLPTSLVITAGCDPLRDEGKAYADELTKAGVTTRYYCFDEMIHAFINIHDLVPDHCQQLYQLIGDFINQAD